MAADPPSSKPAPRQMSLAEAAEHADRLAAEGRLDEAEAFCRRVLPGLAPAHHAMGVISLARSDFRTALSYFSMAVALQPAVARFQVSLGRALLGIHEDAEAVAAARQAVALDPSSSPARALLGTALLALGETAEAIEHLRQAVTADARNAAAWRGLGTALLRQGQPSSASEALRAAVELHPEDATAWGNLSAALQDQGRRAEADEASQRALALEPGNLVVQSNALFYANYDEVAPEALFARHQAFGQRLAVAERPWTPPPAWPGERPLRIGYVSPDFRAHSVAFFIGPVLERHDRSAFQVFAYDNTFRRDAMSEYLRGQTDVWRDIAGLDDETVARRIADDGIDILVDLAGHTANGRLRVFAMRPAPVQVAYLGYPNTTGLRAIRYRITDAWADPVGATEQLHTERLVRPFPSFLCYGPPADCPAVSGLPARGGRVTFGSFNHYRKINGRMGALWAELLERVPGSRLVLKNRHLEDAGCRSRLLALFAEHGIGAERLDLLGYVPSYRAHLEAYGAIDVALDTFPYHGTTTTCEALWMGVPVVTLAGAVHRSRVGVSLLSNLGHPELIAATDAEYVALAAELAADLDRLAALRAGLRGEMARSPVMDGSGFARALEAGYREMWRDYCGSSSLVQ